MSRATKLTESIYNLGILEAKSNTIRVGGIVKTPQGLKVLVNDVPEGNITLLNDDKHTLVLELFGERLEFTPDKLSFKDPYKKLNNWDIPITEIINRHTEEFETHADTGKENRRKAKELYQSDPEAQSERSAQVLKALNSYVNAVLSKNGNACLVSSITAGDKPFEYNINYKENGDILSIPIDLSRNRSIWSNSLSKKNLCAKLLPDMISEVSKAGFSNMKMYW